MDVQKIGDFLKALRKSQGLTQEDAIALYVSIKTVSRWENGSGIPDINIISSVAEFYGITVDELLKVLKQLKFLICSQVAYFFSMEGSLSCIFDGLSVKKLEKMLDVRYNSVVNKNNNLKGSNSYG